LALVEIAYHGSLHASARFVGRGERGRFRSLRSVRECDWPRWGPLLGRAGRERLAQECES
jgi:hypothetical protein